MRRPKIGKLLIVLRASEEDRALGAFLGLAIGDALGTALEFEDRDASPPVTDIVGGGPFQLAPGQWTDDTAMALALADSLLACDGLNETDLMDRFIGWRDNGHYSCTGSCFDIGAVTENALNRYQQTGDPIAGSTDPNHAGNGSLMRLAPVVLHAIRHGECYILDIAERQSATTHAAAECVDACRQFALMLLLAINGEGRNAYDRPWSAATPAVDRVLNGSWRVKRRNEIRSTGYVVDSLEAAIWAVARTTNFRDALVLAVNLAGDSDTIGAITGQLAGALYGLSEIPTDWLDKLPWHEQIKALGSALLCEDVVANHIVSELSVRNGDKSRNSDQNVDHQD